MAHATAPADAFQVDTGLVYLDSATYGLPPTSAVDAMKRALAQWQSGAGRWVDDWDRPAESCRADFASLAGLDARGVALVPAASLGVGLVAATLGPKDEVVVPTDEFTSVLFPVLVASDRGCIVREVSFTELAAAITAQTTLVAFSLVQMQTGLRADMTAIRERAQSVGARLLVDVTQALPFLDAPDELVGVDYVVCAAYKHLLSPRGAAFFWVRDGLEKEIPPIFANWRAADEPYGRYFGGPLTLAEGGAAFDLSLAWICWVGARESLALLASWRSTDAFARVRAYARRLAQELGLPSPPSTLVCVGVADPGRAQNALAEAGIRASVRGVAVRLAPHVYTRDQDIDAAIAALRPLVATKG